MIICLCHRVTDRDVAVAVRCGCDSFDALRDELRVATGCGACADCALETFHLAHRGEPAGVVAIPCPAPALSWPATRSA